MNRPHNTDSKRIYLQKVQQQLYRQTLIWNTTKNEIFVVFWGIKLKFTKKMFNYSNYSKISKLMLDFYMGEPSPSWDFEVESSSNRIYIFFFCKKLRILNLNSSPKVGRIRTNLAYFLIEFESNRIPILPFKFEFWL